MSFRLRGPPTHLLNLWRERVLFTCASTCPSWKFTQFPRILTTFVQLAHTCSKKFKKHNSFVKCCLPSKIRQWISAMISATISAILFRLRIRLRFRLRYRFRKKQNFNLQPQNFRAPFRRWWSPARSVTCERFAIQVMNFFTRLENQIRRRPGGSLKS